MKQHPDVTTEAGEFGHLHAQAAPTDQPPPAPPKISREEMLHLANVNLRLENVRMQKELLRRDEEGIQREMKEIGEGFNKKYNLDPAKHRVLPDGTIIEIGASNTPAVPRRI